MRNDLTIIYYSSNQEEPEFEAKITNLLIRMSKGLPIISVSQKPMDLGQNICVGNVGCSDHNIFSQIRRGLMACKTRFVCFAESDCLYPPEGYFDFVPSRDDRVFLDTNLHILYMGEHKYKAKDYSLCALMVGREYMLDCINRMTYKYPEWKPNRKKFRPLWHKGEAEQWMPWKSKYSVINIKTGRGLRATTGTTGQPIRTLPYWGSAIHVEKKLWTI